jgi:hypothetical protein
LGAEMELAIIFAVLGFGDWFLFGWKS